MKNIDDIINVFKSSYNWQYTISKLSDSEYNIFVEYIRKLISLWKNVVTICDMVWVSKYTVYKILKKHNIKPKLTPRLSYEDRQRIYKKILILKADWISKIVKICDILWITRNDYVLSMNKNSRESICVKKESVVNIEKDKKVIFGNYKLPQHKWRYRKRQQKIYLEFINNKTVKNNINIIYWYIHKEAIINIMCWKYDVKELEILF